MRVKLWVVVCCACSFAIAQDVDLNWWDEVEFQRIADLEAWMKQKFDQLGLSHRSVSVNQRGSGIRISPG